MTEITTLLRGHFYSLVGLAVVDPLAKFKQCSFIYFKNIEGGGVKIIKRVT